MCTYSLLSFVITSFEVESLQVSSRPSFCSPSLFVLLCALYRPYLIPWQTDGIATQSSHLTDAACEVLSAPTLAEVFWEMVRKPCV